MEGVALQSLVFANFLLVFLFNLFAHGFYFSLVASPLATLCLYAFRVYDPESLKNYNEQLVRTTVASVISLLLTLMFTNGAFTHSLENLLLTVVAIPPLNFLWYRIVLKRQPVKRYLVLGDEKEFWHILKEIEGKSFGKIRFAEFLNPSPAKLKAKVDRFDAVLVTDPAYEDLVADLDKSKVEYLPNLVEKTLKRIPVEVAQKFKDYYQVSFENARDDSPAKRILDVLVALVGLVVFSPFMLFIALAILIEDGRPVIFKQKRIGKNGKIFVMLKFRSMRNEEKTKAKFVDDEHHRILKIGRLIRPFRMDEILQFVNVLRGEMSVVGPRPEQEEFVRIYEKEIPFYHERHRVKPGITGWAQLMYKYSSSVEEAKEKLSYDLWYVKNRNIFLDLRIVLQTVEAMLWRRGAK